MSDDLAMLGLGVDSGPVTKAATELDKLTAAAKDAQGAAQGLEKGATKTATATQTLAAGVAKAKAAHGQLGGEAQTTTAQILALQHAIRSATEQIALGVSPLTVLTQQLSHLSFVASGPGGITGTLSAVASSIASVITPFRLAAVGIGAFGIAVVAAAVQFENSQERIRLALTGVGAASGVTVAQINQIGIAAAQAGKLTVGEATDMAAAFAATGRVSADVALQAVLIGRNVSKVFGEDIADASARLARALADPAKGVDDFNKRLAAFNDQATQQIKNLTAAGRLHEAQKLLIDGVSASTAAATTFTTGWAAAYEELRVSASKYFNLFAGGASSALGFGTLDQQIEKTLGEIKTLSNQGILQPLFNDQLREANERLAKMLDQLEKIQAVERQAKFNRDSVELGNLTRGALGANADSSARARLLADLQGFIKLAADPNVLAGLDEATKRDLAAATRIYALRVDGYKTSIELAQIDYEFNIRALNARTAQQKGELAFDRELSRLNAQADPNAGPKARLAQRLEVASIEHQILETQKQQKLAADQKIQTSALELSLVGQTANTQERQKAILQVKQELEAESLRLYGTTALVNKQQLETLTAQAVKNAEITASIRERNFYLEQSFNRDQMGRGPLEGDIYSQLKSAGLLTNNQIQGTAAESAAAYLRVGQAIKTVTDLEVQFASGFLTDLRNGKSAIEALHNALNKFADKLLDLATTNAFQALFGSVNKSLLGSLLGPQGTAVDTTGNGLTSIPAYHAGGIAGRSTGMTRQVPASVFAGAPHYHSGGVAGLGRGEVPAVLKRGEMVLPQGFQSGGMQLNVQVINNTPAQVQAREEQDGRGGRRLVVQIDEMVATAVNRPGSASLGALRSSNFMASG